MKTYLKRVFHWGGVGGGVGGDNNALLLENGSYFLLETGDRLTLE